MTSEPKRPLTTFTLAVTCTLFVAATARADDEELTGTIRAVVDAEEPILEAWAVARKYTKLGVYGKRYPATLKKNKLTAANLPAPGRYDLAFRTKSGFVEGWDATVPESDYVEEQPLGDKAKRKILEKTARNSTSKYGDRVVVLDIHGNVQNAAVLVTLLRWRPFVSEGYKPGEWTWRVERWQWEDPMEHTWTVVQDRPYYALVRKRFYRKDFEALRTTYARHLGGFVLTADRPDRDVGIIRVPRPRPGTHAVNPDGSATRPLVIKPWQVPDPKPAKPST